MKICLPVCLSLLIAVWQPVSGQREDMAERDRLFEAAVEEMYPRLVETRRDIHAHPELSNEEERTGALVAERLKALGMEVTTWVAGHGVVGLLQGEKKSADGQTKTVAVRADMDALPITQLRSLPYRSKNPGVMHACGHDVHTTVVLGLAELLAAHRDQFSGAVKFIFQPAEESMPTDYPGDWGAKLMVAEGVMENPRPDAIFALHCSPAVTPAGAMDDSHQYLSAGQVAYTIGPASANSDTFDIVIKGKMAHGSRPHFGVDAIAVAAEVVGALQTIRSRKTNTQQPLVLTVGQIQGGRRHNILADEVMLKGTVRTYDEAFRDGVIELMHQVLKGVTTAHGAEYQMEFRKGYPSIINDRELALTTLPSLQRVLGEENVLEVVSGMGGEDFSYFAKVSPGFYFRLGVANEEKGITAEVHTPGFDVDEECLKTGVMAMAAAVCDFLDAR